MVIGRADGPFSANVHASVPGVVRDIRSIFLPGGGTSEAVVIALEGSFDKLGRKGERYLWRSMGRNDMLAALRDKGVVDAEEPGVPLFDLLSDRKEIELLALNAVECEPYLRAESCLLRDRGDEVMEGLAILRKILAPKRTVVAASCSPFPELKPAQDDGPVEFLPIEPKYPQDMRRPLLEAIGAPEQAESMGALILRPSTAFAIYEAVVRANPMVERYVSVGGGAIKRPAVLKVRIGTPIGDLIEECGGFLGPPARLVLSGVLRGQAVHDLDVPISKTTTAVIALDAEEAGAAQRSACIRCGRCTEVCSEGLDPDLLYRFVERGLKQRSVELGLLSCTACGACSYVCPARLPLSAAFAAAAKALGEAAAGLEAEAKR
jgi:electron transport complex, RnfABCDGE type, C subunit